MRTDPERQKKPPLESWELPEFDQRPFDFEKCRKAWTAVGVIANEKEIREHMAKLEEWGKRRVKR